MFATRRRSFGSPTRAEALVLGQNCASLVTKITIFALCGVGWLELARFSSSDISARDFLFLFAASAITTIFWNSKFFTGVGNSKFLTHFLEFQIFYLFFGIPIFLLIFWRSKFFTYVCFGIPKNFFLDFVTDRQTDGHNKGRGILVV